MAEYWDIYDCNRIRTGRTHLRGIPVPDGDYHLVVRIWLLNSSGQVLLTQRHPDKPHGGLWECTGDSAISGEESLTAALRETAEEIGLFLEPTAAVLLQSEKRLHSFLDSWLFRQDIPLSQIVMQREEVTGAMWVDQITFDQMEESGLIVPTVKNFYRDFRGKYEQVAACR